MGTQTIAFFLLGALAILASLGMIVSRNAVHSAVFLMLAFFNFAGIYILLGAEFIAAVQIVVYSGAILVLFLFVIMLLQMRNEPKIREIGTVNLATSIIMGLLVLGEILAIIFNGIGPKNTSAGGIDWTHTNSLSYAAAQDVITGTTQMGTYTGNTQVLGNALYNVYVLPFEIISLVLLIAAIGAIVVARRELPSLGERLSMEADTSGVSTELDPHAVGAAGPFIKA